MVNLLLYTIQTKNISNELMLKCKLLSAKRLPNLNEKTNKILQDLFTDIISHHDQNTKVEQKLVHSRTDENLMKELNQNLNIEEILKGIDNNLIEYGNANHDFQKDNNEHNRQNNESNNLIILHNNEQKQESDNIADNSNDPEVNNEETDNIKKNLQINDNIIPNNFTISDKTSINIIDIVDIEISKSNSHLNGKTENRLLSSISETTGLLNTNNNDTNESDLKVSVKSTEVISPLKENNYYIFDNEYFTKNFSNDVEKCVYNDEIVDMLLKVNITLNNKTFHIKL